MKRTIIITEEQARRLFEYVGDDGDPKTLKSDGEDSVPAKSSTEEVTTNTILPQGGNKSNKPEISKVITPQKHAEQSLNHGYYYNRGWGRRI